MDIIVHMNSTCYFHLEGNPNVNLGAKVAGNSGKASNVSNIVEPSLDRGGNNQPTAKKNRRSVYKRNIASKTFLFFFLLLVDIHLILNSKINQQVKTALTHS